MARPEENHELRQYVLGYDLRFAFEAFVTRDWTAARRARYLLRPEIAEPASVDTAVWPSRFVFPGSYVSRQPDGLARAAVEIRYLLQNAVDLWPEPEEMRAAFQASGLGGGAIALAVTLVGDRALVADDTWAALIDPDTAPGPPSPGWTCMGYDIADSGLTSGLSNCGYEPAETTALRADWSERLNRHGLFDSPADADAFRALADRRVPEHQPFYVFGLYRNQA
ncbi:MAG: hypothetical protein QF893_06765 [Alphaproteobacteria bacterium]|jgi:hypothetical protein|nr:hypothetical protein [Alphaproteobacteria bacterium]